MAWLDFVVPEDREGWGKGIGLDLIHQKGSLPSACITRPLPSHISALKMEATRLFGSTHCEIFKLLVMMLQIFD
jgi:hypothetical protein